MPVFLTNSNSSKVDIACMLNIYSLSNGYEEKAKALGVLFLRVFNIGRRKFDTPA